MTFSSSFIRFGERKSFRLFQRIAQRIERAVGQAGHHVNLAEPESCVQIVRLEFANARQRRNGLAKVSVLRRQVNALHKTKTRFIETARWR